MSNVRHLKPEHARLAIDQLQRMADNADMPSNFSGGGGTTLEKRVTDLENIARTTSERLGKIEQDLAIIKSDIGAFKQEAFRSFATKADVAEAKNSIIMWVVSAILLAQLLPSLLKKFGL